MNIRYKILCSMLLASCTFAGNVHITGTVVLKNNTPVSGVTVTLAHSGFSSVTDNNGVFLISDTITGISDQTQKSPIVSPVYNPYSGVLSFSISRINQPVTIDLLATNGKHIQRILNQPFQPGMHHIKPFSAVTRQLSHAVYLLRLTSGAQRQIIKALNLHSVALSQSAPNTTTPDTDQRDYFRADTVRFTKTNFLTKDTVLLSTKIDLGKVTILQYPQCSITTPSNNATVSFGDSIPIAVTASDNDGSVASVAFYVGGELQKTLTASPFTHTWNTLRHTIGKLPVTVEVKDSDGLIKKDSVSITVSLTKARVYTYTVIKKYNHDSGSYTQGLVYENGFFYEGSGLNGRSTLRKVEIETGKVLKSISLAQEYFGEGIVIWKDTILQLTWQENVIFAYNKETFKKLTTYNNPHDGWGITHDGEKLILSDGSSYLFFWDHKTMKQTDSVHVKDQNNFVPDLNELEYFYHKVFANIYQTDLIAMIDVASGTLLGTIDCTGLLNSKRAGVLNGIAYAPDNDRIFLTGKEWPWLFEVKLKLKI